jgi:hypothetical protein
MALRSIITILAPEPVPLAARVYRDDEWNEYRVRLFLNGALWKASTDYHTDSRQDAIRTARQMLANATAEAAADVADALAQNLDERPAVFGLGASRAQMHRRATSRAFGAHLAHESE